MIEHETVTTSAADRYTILVEIDHDIAVVSGFGNFHPNLAHFLFELIKSKINHLKNILFSDSQLPIEVSHGVDLLVAGEVFYLVERLVVILRHTNKNTKLFLWDELVVISVE